MSEAMVLISSRIGMSRLCVSLLTIGGVKSSQMRSPAAPCYSPRMDTTTILGFLGVLAMFAGAGYAAWRGSAIGRVMVFAMIMFSFIAASRLLAKL
jgi:hypothetical protein